MSSFAVVSSSSVIFSLTNLLPSAVMFDFLREPSFLPIVPISVYVLLEELVNTLSCVWEILFC